MTADEIWAALEAAARGMEPLVKRAWLDAVKALRSTVPQSVLEEAARTKNVDLVLRYLDLTDYQLAVRSSLLRLADTDALPFEVRFDALDPYAVRAIRAGELALVRSATLDIRAGILQALEAGLRAGVNPVDTARNIRTLIGLTPKQVTAVNNYRSLLTGGAKGQPYREALRRVTRDGRFDRSVLRAIEEKTPLSPTQVTRQLERFEARLLDQHAKTIARTETMDALERAQQLRWQEMIDQGKVTARQLRRFWHTARDERTCPICASIPGLNEDGVEWGVPFDTPDGPLMGPTAHPNCRCITFTRVVFNKRGVCLVDLRKFASSVSGLRHAA